MKSNLLVLFIALVTIAVVAVAGLQFYLSKTSEFSRAVPARNP
ncbi:MAG: hypothetical protein RL346_1446 [Verrucomicrobiota bacterium]|jgi:hypothetical protein